MDKIPTFGIVTKKEVKVEEDEGGAPRKKLLRRHVARTQGRRHCINPKDESIMLHVKAGPVPIGTDEEEIDAIVRETRDRPVSRKWYFDEAPRRVLDLEEYWMYQAPVMNFQFERFVNETRYVTEAERKGAVYTWRSFFHEHGDDYPVIRITYDDALEYCKWAGVVLPTEIQWEKAARGAKGKRWPWGQEWHPDWANNWKMENLMTLKLMLKIHQDRGPCPTGSFKQNISDYGILDMAGNLWEWTQSWYQAYPGSRLDGNLFGEKYRVVKGGSWWDDEPLDMRGAFRGWADPHLYAENIGFRPVNDQPPEGAREYR